MKLIFLLLLLLRFLLLLSMQDDDHVIAAATPFPLSTSSRWIVEESTGRRVKLACNTWPSHLESMVAEGMAKQPLDAIGKQIAAMGFNCIRLTWPLYLITTNSGNLTVRQSFHSLGLAESIAAVQVHNPDVLDLTLIETLKAVVTTLAHNNIMVILDNHISKPGWCCYIDGNGFFGDQYFNPDEWIKALMTVATMFKGHTNVVAMSLRNELRGPKQNVNKWFKYMQMGAEAVHSANPNVLVILSGLTWDTNLSHLHRRKVNMSFTGKLAFELHWYAFTDKSVWVDGNPNQVCGRVVASIMRRAGFLLDQGYPLILSEFGFDQRGTNVNDNRYLNCMLATIAELDMDWFIWGLPGTYYIKEGIRGFDDPYGTLNWDWNGPRNSTMLQRMQSVQSPFRGPGTSNLSPYTILFHPLTGSCVLRNSEQGFLHLGPCKLSEAWIYEHDQTLQLRGKYLCLMSDGIGKPARLGSNCSYSNNSKWKLVSASKMHLASKPARYILCLDVDPISQMIVTNRCKCLRKDKYCDPASQWFKMVESTRRVLVKNSIMDSISQQMKRLGDRLGINLLSDHPFNFLTDMIL